MPAQWSQISTALASHTHCLKVLATFTSLSLGLQLKEIDHLCLRFKFRRSGMTLLCCLRQQLCWEMLLIEVLHFSHVAHILLMALLQLL